MATELTTTVNAYRRLPAFDVPSNQVYQTHDTEHPDSAAETAARTDAKKQFLSGDSDLRWPELQYPRLNIDELSAQRSMLLGLLEDIDDAPSDVSNVQLDATYDALHMKLEEINRHLAVARRIGGAASKAAEWLDVYSDEELREHAAIQGLESFGRPETGRFNWFLARDRKLAEQKLLHDNPFVRQMAQDFLSQTDEVTSNEVDAPSELDAETRRQVREDLYVIFPGLEEFCNQDFPDKVAAQDVLPYFDQIRDILGLPADRFRSYHSNKRACEEQPDGVAVGLKRTKPFEKNDIIRLAFHEWMHVFRRYNSENQENPARRIPTRNNTAFEEAFCVLLERALIDQSYTAGEGFYKSIGLLMGLDRSQDPHNLSEARDFRDAMNIAALAEALKSGVETEEGLAVKVEAMYARTNRTTRGGAPDARDLSYHLGDESAKKSVNDIKQLPDDERRSMLRWYMSSQFDPTDEFEAKINK